MVRIIFSDGEYTGQTPPVFCVFTGKSTDSKTTANVMTGSVFIEANTGTAYMFEEDTTTWYEVGGSDA